MSADRPNHQDKPGYEAGVPIWLWVLVYALAMFVVVFFSRS